MRTWQGWLRRVAVWLRDHEPVMCGVCGKVKFGKDTRTERTLTGQVARVCEPCHREYFSPFGGR